MTNNSAEKLSKSNSECAASVSDQNWEDGSLHEENLGQAQGVEVSVFYDVPAREHSVDAERS